MVRHDIISDIARGRKEASEMVLAARGVRYTHLQGVRGDKNIQGGVGSSDILISHLGEEDTLKRMYKRRR
jgi:uncharacterized protein YfiM (DUF2279 family)